MIKNDKKNYHDLHLPHSANQTTDGWVNERMAEQIHEFK